jgi:hypothetical protein
MTFRAFTNRKELIAAIVVLTTQFQLSWQYTSQSDGRTFPSAGFSLSFRALGRLAQNEKLGCTGRETRRGGGMGQTETAMTGKNRIMIYKTDGAYIVEFRTADGESLAISIP